MKHMDERILNILNEAEKIKKMEEIKKEKVEQDELAEIKRQIRCGILTDHDHGMELLERSLYQDQFKIYIPKRFAIMDEKIVTLKYPTQSRPQLIYTNAEATVDIGFNLIPEQLEDEDVPEFRDIVINHLKELQPHAPKPEKGELFVSGKSPTQRPGNRHKVAYYTYTNHIIGGQMYNHVFISTVGGNILVCNMNCLKKDQKKWQLIFMGIMHTVTFNEREESV